MKRKNCFVGTLVQVKRYGYNGVIVQLLDDGDVLVEVYEMGRGMNYRYSPNELRKRTKL